LKINEKKITEHPASCSWRLPLWAKRGMETRTGDGVSNSSQDSVHQSDEDIAQDHQANVSKKWFQVVQQDYTLSKEKRCLSRVIVIVTKMFPNIKDRIHWRKRIHVLQLI